MYLLIKLLCPLQTFNNEDDLFKLKEPEKPINYLNSLILLNVKWKKRTRLNYRLVCTRALELVLIFQETQRRTSLQVQAGAD